MKSNLEWNMKWKKNGQCRRSMILFMAGLCCVLVLLLAGCGGQRPTAPKAAQNNWLRDDAVISLYQHETGEIVEIPLREYLYGVVAGEMDVNWPVEALAAQAIMARTFTLEKIEDGGVVARGTDASTDIKEFQAYHAENVNDTVKKAVDETANLVAVYDGQLIKAWFFADGGGRTAASAAEGLAYDKEETPYIQSVEDPGFALAENPNRAWETYFSMAQVADAVEQITGTRQEQFQTVSIAEQGPSGRATQYQFDEITVSAPALRLALGGETMKSNLVDEINLQDGQLMIKGRGYGHGVGMSQWGARALAEQGKSAEEIVQYFFKDVEIQQVSQ